MCANKVNEKLLQPYCLTNQSRLLLYSRLKDDFTEAAF